MATVIDALVADIGQYFEEHQLKLVTAESCTGGGLGYVITSLPGSSAWYDRGFITYSNASKEELIGVNSLTLNEFGAVSEQTVREMAEGALRESQAQISIAITGIAGPEGGTIDKPVGTVWIAYARRNTETQSFVGIFSGNNRQEIRQQAITLALEKLLAFTIDTN